MDPNQKNDTGDHTLPAPSVPTVIPQQGTAPNPAPVSEPLVLAELKKEVLKEKTEEKVTVPTPPKEDWSEALAAAAELKPKGADALLGKIQQAAAPSPKIAVAGVHTLQTPHVSDSVKAAITGIPSAPSAVSEEIPMPFAKATTIAPEVAAEPTTAETAPKHAASIPLVSISVPKGEGLKPSDIKVKKLPPIGVKTPPQAPVVPEPAPAESNPIQDALVAKLKASAPQAPAPTPKERPQPGATARIEALEQRPVFTPEETAVTPPTPAPKPAPAEEKAISNIRTFKTDVQHTLVKQQTSVVSAITAEEERRAKRPHASIAGKVALLERRALLIGSIIFVLAGIGVAAYVFVLTRGGETPAALTIESPIFTEEEVGVDVSGFSRSVFLKNLSNEVKNVKLTLGAVSQLYLYEKGMLGNRVLTTEDFFNRIESSLPNSGLRAMQPDIFIGVHAFDGNQPFLIINTNYYESAYSAMLQWEPDMQRELVPFFGPLVTSGFTTTPLPVATTTATSTPTTTATSTATTTTPGTQKPTTTPPKPKPVDTGSGTGTGTGTGGGTTPDPDTGSGGGSDGGVITPPPPPPPPIMWLFGTTAHAQSLSQVPRPEDYQNTSTTPQAITDTSYLRRFIPEFSDNVVNNYDVRELKDAAGNTVLMYGFPFPDVLIITTNQYTFKEAVSRIVNERN